MRASSSTAEQLSCTQKVVGSIPACVHTWRNMRSMVERARLRSRGRWVCLNKGVQFTTERTLKGRLCIPAWSKSETQNMLRNRVQGNVTGSNPVSSTYIRWIKSFIRSMAKRGLSRSMTGSWIDSQLMVGDMIDANIRSETQKIGIDFLIDIRQWFYGSGEAEPRENITEMVETLLEITKKYKVLIYCTAGIDRTPFVAMLYCHLKYGWDYYKSYDYVKEKRPETFIHYEWISKL